MLKSLPFVWATSVASAQQTPVEHSDTRNTKRLAVKERAIRLVEAIASSAKTNGVAVPLSLG